ncbi:MAG: hypothetical protein ACTSVL_12405 [Promethearchaeota archaeon]
MEVLYKFQLRNPKKSKTCYKRAADLKKKTELKLKSEMDIPKNFTVCEECGANMVYDQKICEKCGWIKH